MSLEGKTRTVTFASGKGGAGKTSISVNLALSLAAMGSRACLFDADLGLGNVNIMLGLNPEHDLEDVVSGDVCLRDILIKDYQGIDIIPGSSGVEKIANLDQDEVDRLISSFSEFEGYDFLLFDASAGASKNVVAFCLASAEIVVILNPEPTSLTDAYSLLKILTMNGFRGIAKVVVNQSKTLETAKTIFDKFKGVVEKYLRLEISLLGIVIQDAMVSEAVKSQQALVLRYPESNAAKCIRHIAKNLLEKRPDDLENLGVRPFLQRALEILKKPLDLKGPEKKARQQSPERTAKAKNTQKEMPKADPGNGAVASSVALEGGKSPGEKGTRMSVLHPAQPDQDRRPSDGNEVPSSRFASPVSGDVRLLMNQLIDAVSSVTEELHLLRKAQEGSKKDRRAPGSQLEKTEGDKRTSTQPIILDFEAFSRQASATEKKEGMSLKNK